MRDARTAKRPVPLVNYMGFHFLGARLRWIGRYSKRERMFRAIRLIWRRGDLGKGGYSAKISLAFRPKLFGWLRDWHEWDLTIAGVRLHYRRNYGGGFV